MTNMDKLLLLPNSNEDGINLLKDEKIKKEVAPKTELPHFPKYSIMYFLLKLCPLWLALFSLLWILPFFILDSDNNDGFNPCDSTNPQIFQKFVTAWKGKNEAQKGLNQWKKWINDSKTHFGIREYYKQKIQISTIQIETLNASLNPQFDHFENCLLSNANSPLNFVFFYWISVFLIFTIGAIIIYSSIKHISKSYEANQSLVEEQALKNIWAAETFEIICITIFTGLISASFYMHENMKKRIPTELDIYSI